MFYHAMGNLLKNKDTHIMVNNSHLPIPQVQDKKKRYTTRYINWANRARKFQHITGQPIKRILYAVDNDTLKNI